MNKKGFTLTISVVIALLTSGIVLASVQPLILNKANINKKIEDFTQEKVKSRNGLERLYGMYDKDISDDTKEITFDDLGLTYKIEQIGDIKTRIIKKSVLSGSVFRVNNKTDLVISLSGVAQDGKKDAYIDVILDKKGINEKKQNFELFDSYRIYLDDDNLVITLDKDNYGDYRLIYLENNILKNSLDVEINYIEQSYRRIKITENGDRERVLVIENDVIENNLDKYFEM